MATITTTSNARGWAPDFAVPAGDAVPQSLIVQAATFAGDIEGDAPAVDVVFVDDAAAGFVPEGGAITESDPGLAEVRIYTGKVAQLVRVSREQAAQINAARLLSESVSRAVTRAADAAFIAQTAPTPPQVTPPAGLLNVPGILAGAVTGDLDGLIDLAAQIAGNNGQASHVILAPTSWATLRKLKDGTGRSLLGAGTDDAVPALLGLPVLISPAVPAGMGLLIDKTAVAAAWGALNVTTSEHAYFGYDSIGLRCTWRFGANLVPPNRCAKFTVDAGK